jgi:hypothetical protein
MLGFYPGYLLSACIRWLVASPMAVATLLILVRARQCYALLISEVCLAEHWLMLLETSFRV